ncbi:hypothetical protein [Alkalihalobacillus sp. AL-G]|uniref:hypothetical protein n=1 Tax=Alkalihalobacillus sp. AL-G TaxID=2926399 RepID=UPI00272A73D4|nr:hypothetical protein [Alkalihalobacillus sp. AL-G]WLD94581.1 hypothetical protein MOJ78_06770 [Alkalihalobacillus sp. AL-G]
MRGRKYLEIQHTLTFIEHGGKPTLIMIGVPASPTEEEAKTFEESQEMVQKGFEVTFDQLVDYLSKVHN